MLEIARTRDLWLFLLLRKHGFAAVKAIHSNAHPSGQGHTQNIFVVGYFIFTGKKTHRKKPRSTAHKQAPHLTSLHFTQAATLHKNRNLDRSQLR
uniref:Putative secreted protein n=1 Tax=Anopheles triannulatus TaxID=58253 RepID=A0A2M4B2E8_9DIPT